VNMLHLSSIELASCEMVCVGAGLDWVMDSFCYGIKYSPLGE